MEDTPDPDQPPWTAGERFRIAVRMSVLGAVVLGMPLLALPPVLSRVDRWLERSAPALSGTAVPAESADQQVWIVRD